jgi:hypothetical protein
VRIIPTYLQLRIRFLVEGQIEVCGKKESESFQELLNEISFFRFLEQVDNKIWRVHLLYTLEVL